MVSSGSIIGSTSEQSVKVLSEKSYFPPIRESFRPQKFPTIWYALKVHTPQYTSVHHSTPQYTSVYHSIPQYTSVYLSIPQYTTVYHNIPQYTTVYHNIPHTQFRPHGCLGQLYHGKFCILHTIGTLGQKHKTYPHSSSIQSAYYLSKYSIFSYLEGVNHSIVQHTIQVQRHIVWVTKKLDLFSPTYVTFVPSCTVNIGILAGYQI